MNLKTQIKIITRTLEEQKAKNIISIKVSTQSADMDVIIIASSNSTRHVRGIANNIKTVSKQKNMQILGIEGLELSQWVLIDLTTIIVHIMLDKTRDFYKLEELWSIN